MLSSKFHFFISNNTRLNLNFHRLVEVDKKFYLLYAINSNALKVF